jgi:hypothetical protein
MPERRYDLGLGFEAVPLEHGRGFKIEKKGAPWETDKLLRGTYQSLQEAREAYSKFLEGKRNPTRLGEGYSLISK